MASPILSLVSDIIRRCRFCGEELSDFHPFEFCDTHDWMRWYRFCACCGKALGPNETATWCDRCDAERLLEAAFRSVTRQVRSADTATADEDQEAA